MLPLGDVVPRRTRPMVTAGLAAGLAVSLLLFHLVLRPQQQLQVLWSWGVSRELFPWPSLLSAPWIEPLWLAGLANIAALLFFGPAVEDRLGRWRFAALVACAACLGAATTIVLFKPPALPAAGIAAPAAAVMATYLTLFPQSKLVFWSPLPYGGRLHEVTALWPMAVWALIVPGNLARYTQSGLFANPPLVAIALALVLGAACGPLLVPGERRLVSWWETDRN